MSFGPVPQWVNYPQLELPTFHGSKDVNVRHFFLKLRVCFGDNNVVYSHVKRRYLMHCLSGDALDLYLALQPSQQTNLRVLEKGFMKHFRPAPHKIASTAIFISSRKGSDETL